MAKRDSGNEAGLATKLIACLDLTELGDACTADDVSELLERAVTPVGTVAAVCVWPKFVAQCRTALEDTPVRIATVVNFPGGDEDYADAIETTRKAIADGADEIDMVISYRRLPEAPDFVTGQVADFVEAADGRLVKAILETGEIGSPDVIRLASQAAIAGGARFIKTSTGKTPKGASLEAARVMLEVIEETDKGVGLKPSGGVRTLEDGCAYLALCDEIMGSGWATPETFRIGASSLLTDLLTHLGKGDGSDRKGSAY